MEVIERIMQRVKQGVGCWPWSGYHHEAGYAIATVNKKPRRVHRILYESYVGPIPEGLQLDHLCRNRGCVNPAHLELVTGKENVVRAFAFRTHCKAGHERNDKNSYIFRGWKSCLICRKARDVGRPRQSVARRKKNDLRSGADLWF